MGRPRTLTLVRLTLLLFALFSGLFAATAQAYPPATPGQRVYDLAGYLPDGARRHQLNRELLAFEAAHRGTQVAVVTVPDTEGEGLERYANGLFRAWGIGQQGQNNGVLLLISRTADAAGNKTRIEVGYGLEGALPDATCHRIITETIMPLARDQHNPQGAIEAGARLILHHLGGQGPLGPMGGPTTMVAQPRPSDAPPGILLIIFLVIVGAGGLALWTLTTDARRAWARRRTQREQHASATQTLLGALMSRSDVLEDARATLLLPAGKQAIDGFITGTERMKREAETALAQMAQAIERDESYAVRRALDHARLGTRAIERSVTELRQRVERFRHCAEGITTALETAATAIARAEEALTAHRQRGIRIPADALARAEATLAQARACVSPPEGSLPDPETAESLAAEAVRQAKGIEATWENRLARARQVDEFLHSIPARIDALRKQVPEARDALKQLRMTHAEDVWRPAEQALANASQAFEPLLNLGAKAVNVNGVLRQEYERAAELRDEISAGLTELERRLHFPKAQLTAAEAAKADSVRWPERARHLEQELEALVAHADTSADLKRRIRHAIGSLRTASVTPHDARTPDWIALASAYHEATGAATRLRAAAEAEIAAKRPKPRPASSGSGSGSPSPSSYSPSWDTSSPSSSWSSSDSGSSFGGGDSGGGGSSGGFD